MTEQKLRQNTESFIANAPFIKELYDRYLQNPNSIDQSWQKYFAEIGDDLNGLNQDFKSETTKIIGIQEYPQESSKKAKKSENKTANLSYKINNLINSFRKVGHLASDLDPLKLKSPEYHPSLDATNHDISDNELHEIVNNLDNPNFVELTSSQIINKLHNIYCNKIGYEFEIVEDDAERKWLYEQIETNNITISKDDKKNALNHLHRASSFEQMLHKKFPGAKRFSIEGGDAAIPSLEKIISLAGKSKLVDVEIGMAHRGRLNVLTNVMGKPYDQMIAEFKGASSIPSKFNASGDVKYHMGYSNDRKFSDHNLHIALAYNPSHLEAVNSVIMGKVRAKQDLLKDTERKNTLAVLIHGDAAFMGQGSVAECLNMAYTEGYYVGGTIHIIMNNQIGFTANYDDSRSTRYCSDMAKAIAAPIIHVNGNSVEEILFATELAFNYRHKFGKDIVLDINCYRKYGHNEGDEPNYTQPIMYASVKKMISLDQIYAEQLLGEKVITDNELSELKSKRHAELEDAFQKSDKFKAVKADAFSAKWEGLTTLSESKKPNPKTGVKATKLKNIAHKLLEFPEDFSANPKIAKQHLAKKKIIDSEAGYDWAVGESLAFATLIQEGHNIRISGQDSKRGTFSHRHSVLRDMKTEQEYISLNELGTDAQYEAIDSVLSEYTVLGYEHGYSLSNPHTLAIWEAQFGDFANGAQIIFDQFIASSEAKWLRMSGLTLLLPHGYEGQGPEHSSARIERYLQACAEDNIQVTNTTTPANFFHLLRRQMHRDFKKPLIAITPKSLLRHKLAISDLKDFDEGTSFRPVIAEIDKLNNDKVTKVIFCSGKIYYDLYETRNQKKNNNTAIIRIEELYPFPHKEVTAEIKKYKNAKQVIWCQEEPENMGAWNFIDRRLENAILEAKSRASRPSFVGRVAAASPATGYMSVHLKEQKEIIEKAFK